MRRIALAAIAVLVVAAVLLALSWDLVLDLAIERGILALRPDTAMLEDGGLHLVLGGTGLPVMDAERRASCAAVVAGGEVLLVDAGAGGLSVLSAVRVPVEQLSTVLITHLHSDHIGGLGDAIHMSAFRGRQRPLTVYGPPGVEAVVEGFVLAYAEDARLRSHPQGGNVDPKWMLPGVRVIEVRGDAAVSVLERAGLRVTAFAVDHSPIRPAYGYRVDYAGRSVVFSGDTQLDERLVGHARGADILVHSATGLRFIAERSVPILERLGMERDARLMEEAQRLFPTPVEIAGLAARAGVSTLVFSHVPPIPRVAEPVFLWGVSGIFDGEVVVGRDGMRFDLAGLETW